MVSVPQRRLRAARGAWHGCASTCLVHPVKAIDSDVLIEVEHEQCPYDGVRYVRRGSIHGVFPLLTVKQVGKGLVIRHYSAVDPGKVFADAYGRLVANLLKSAAEKNR